MRLEEALEFIHSTDWKRSQPGLKRVGELMNRLGNPQNDLRFVHVAGTNGKGSVCAMLSSVLTAAGYRTGLYTSPHLLRVNERMKVDGVDISDGDLVSLAERIKPAADAMEDRPTEFELLTAMAFLYFQERRCDIVVLEVGLGGRLDATNLIRAPEAAVICNIGLDHTEVLGNTLGQIAGEKAGIIKPGTSAILYGQSLEVEDVVAQRCRDCGVPLRITDETRETLLSAGLDGQVLRYRERRALRLSLLGTYQYHNAAVALDTVDILTSRGWRIPEEAVGSGLIGAVWPGRFEVIRRGPLVIVDGAHNPNGAEELAKCLDQYLPGRKLTFIMGVMADKDYRRMIRTMAPYAEQFVAVSPPGDRALPSAALREEIASITGISAENGGSVEEGLSLALGRSGPDTAICAFGSLYQAGRVRAFFHKG